MKRDRGLASQHQGGPQPVGWREIVNPKISRRRFLAGTSTAPLLVESALAGTAAPREMALEFDLSDDGSTLEVRQFVKSASPAKGQALAQAWTWRTFAQSYGPSAWFEMRVAADDFDRRVVLRDAKFGGIEQSQFALRFRAEVFTEPVPPAPAAAPGAKKPPAPKPRRYAAEWQMTLETDLWALPGHPDAPWISKSRPFSDFASDSNDRALLYGEIDLAVASDRLYQMDASKYGVFARRRRTTSSARGGGGGF